MATGLDTPTAIAWLPDGRLLVAEKAGVVKLVDRRSAPFGRTILDISERVSTNGDHGLMGLEVDTHFTRNRFLYLAYTFDPDKSRPEPPKTARLSRFRLTRSGRAVDERVLMGRIGRAPCPPPANRVDCMPTDGETHTIGAVRAAADGTLWVAMGDASPWERPNRLALRSFDPRSYAGKLLHVDRRGRGLPNHPFCRREQNLTRVCTRVFARGFRNPFRFTLDPAGTPIVGDVGWESREEIDVVRAGGNYGWPCYEGRIRTPGYDAFRACRRLYAREGGRGAALPPTFDYQRAAEGGAIVAGPRYPDGGVGPFAGAFIFGDYVTGRLVRATGVLGSPAQRLDVLATGWAGVDLRAGPAGELAYPNIAAGSVAALFHAPGNKSPTAAAQATPTAGQLPLRVELRAAAVHDPEGEELTYAWRLGDGTRALGPVVEHTYRRAGTYVARLTVRDPHGATVVAGVRVFAGNRAPRSRIVSPADGAPFTAGRPVQLRAVGRDPEEGRLPGRALRWHVLLRHGDHDHFVGMGRGAHFAFVPRRDHDADSSYRIAVAAVDAAGLVQQRVPHAIELRPRTATIRLDSVPSGAPVAYGGRMYDTPVRRRAAVGYEAPVTAAASFVRGGIRYRFVRWRDGGRRNRTVTIRGRPMRLTAVYEAAGPSRAAGRGG